VLGESEAAEDAVQETFLRAWRSLDQFDDRADLSTWLYRIAVNAAIDLRRKRRRREGIMGPLPGESLDHRAEARSADPSPLRSALSRQTLERARQVIDELPEAERAAILLRHFEGRSIAEIAAALGGGENAAKQAVFRAVQKVRGVLGPMREMPRGETI
jgi:RNA polymerase sigma-70 factor (ECF subfamily)